MGHLFAQIGTGISYLLSFHRITISVLVVFMAWYVMVLRSATSLRGALEGVDPENLDFFGPKWHSLLTSNDVAPQNH